MDETLKTTVYLGAADYRRLKGLGRSRGTKAAALVREAVAEYVERHALFAHRRASAASRAAATTSANVPKIC